MNIDQMMDSLFCPEFRDQIMQHINTCSTCQNGVIALYDQLPVLHMIPGLNKKVKGIINGNGEKSRKETTEGAL